MSNKEMMKKTKLFFSLEKELNYINKMNKEGWKLVYIKGGCVYHFEKTEPDEYFTILHAATKEKVMEISAFAAQCGKAEVSPEFVCEVPEKTESAKRIYHRFRTLSIVFVVISLFLMYQAGFMIGTRMADPDASVALTVICVLFTLFAAVYLAMCVYVLMLTAKACRSYKQLQKESEIYE